MKKKSIARRDYPNITVEQLKRFGYSACIVLGLLSMSTVLLFGSPTFSLSPATETFDRYVYPLLILAGILSIRAMLKGRVPIGKFEKPFVIFFALFFVTKYSLTLLSAPTVLSLAYVESWYWMMIGIWAVSFLAYSFYPALMINLSMYISALSVTTANAWLKLDAPEVMDFMSDIAASNFRLGFSLIALVILGYVKHQWVHIEKEAMLLRSIAHNDPLTGLPNRRRLSEILQGAIDSPEKTPTIILFDLDGFKEINDRFGHTVGDDVLRQVAVLAQECIGDIGTIGRWGGEEFMIVCSNTGIQEAERLAERLRHTFETRPILRCRSITGSFGIAKLQPGETAERLIARADEALYTAKEQGKNQVFSSMTGESSRLKKLG